MVDQQTDIPQSGLDLGREALPDGGFYQPTKEELKQRKKRNYAIGGLLVAFILLIFFTTMMRLQANSKANTIQELAPPPMLADPAQN